MRKPENIPPQDRLLARIAAAASHLSVKVRPVGLALLGTDVRLARVPYSVVDASEVPEGAWAHYDGDPNGTALPVPRWYHLVTRTQIDRDALTELYGGNAETQVAIAWRLGDAVVAAQLSDEQAEAVMTAGYYDTLLGGGPNETTIGLVDVVTDKMHTIPSAATPGEIMKRYPDYPGELLVYPAEGTIY
jgi:hypothetical protein